MLFKPSFSTVRGVVLACLCGSFCAAGGCGSLGSMSSGKMEWVRPDSEGPHVGNVYLVRGWVGIFSGGMDRLKSEINQSGVTARIFQHDQCAELARTMCDRYKSAKNPEPICMIGHSFGSDDALIIARELDKVGVPVDLIIVLDAVNEKIVPKNVKLCYNFWQPGMFGGTNFLRGIPLEQEPGGTGKLLNINLLTDGRALRDAGTNHINIDEGPKLHKAIIQHILETCPTREVWATTHGRESTTAAILATEALPVDVRVHSTEARVSQVVKKGPHQQP